jgi:hypothetical protein
MKPRFMCKGATFLVCSLVILAGATMLFGFGHSLRRFSQIRSGATKAEVLHLVGTPTESLTNILVELRLGGNEAWAYRKESVIVEGMDAIVAGKGFGKRLFLPDTNDYVVVFNGSGVVSRTLEPGAQ